MVSSSKAVLYLPLILISVHTDRDFIDIVKMSGMVCGDHTDINLENRTEQIACSPPKIIPLNIAFNNDANFTQI